MPILRIILKKIAEMTLYFHRRLSYPDITGHVSKYPVPDLYCNPIKKIVYWDKGLACFEYSGLLQF